MSGFCVYVEFLWFTNIGMGVWDLAWMVPARVFTYVYITAHPLTNSLSQTLIFMGKVMKIEVDRTHKFVKQK